MAAVLRLHSRNANLLGSRYYTQRRRRVSDRCPEAGRRFRRVIFATAQLPRVVILWMTKEYPPVVNHCWARWDSCGWNQGVIFESLVIRPGPVGSSTGEPRQEEQASVVRVRIPLPAARWRPNVTYGHQRRRACESSRGRRAHG